MTTPSTPATPEPLMVGAKHILPKPTPATPREAREYWLSQPDLPGWPRDAWMLYRVEQKDFSDKSLPGQIHVREVLARPQEAPRHHCGEVGHPDNPLPYYESAQPPAVEQGREIQQIRVREAIDFLRDMREELMADAVAALSQSKRPMTDKEEALIQAAMYFTMTDGPKEPPADFPGMEKLCIQIMAERAASRTSEPEQSRV